MQLFFSLLSDDHFHSILTTMRIFGKLEMIKDFTIKPGALGKSTTQLLQTCTLQTWCSMQITSCNINKETRSAHHINNHCPRSHVCQLLMQEQIVGAKQIISTCLPSYMELDATQMHPYCRTTAHPQEQQGWESSSSTQATHHLQHLCPS